MLDLTFTYICLSSYRMLEMMIDPESGIRSQNGRSVFEAVSANPVGNRIAFEFFRDRFDEINA